MINKLKERLNFMYEVKRDLSIPFDGFSYYNEIADLIYNSDLPKNLIDFFIEHWSNLEVYLDEHIEFLEEFNNLLDKSKLIKM